MSSMRDVELLRRRSAGFLSHAREALQRGEYDLACFFAEQALQLRLKALLLRMLGVLPRTHGLRELLGILSGALGEHGRRDLAREVSGLARDFRSQLRILEEAYVGSRYLAREYAPEDASESVDLVGRVCRLIDRVEEEVFRD